MNEHARQALNLGAYVDAGQPISLGRMKVSPPGAPQYVLRMLVRKEANLPLRVPDELNWLRPQISFCLDHQRRNGLTNGFVYLTVRHGPTRTKTDDLWHVDGFSMRRAHLPEQNYIWADCHPTQWLRQGFDIPPAFDPLKHNIYKYFQRFARDENIRDLQAGDLYVIDPYVVHRRPPELDRTKWRTFFRVSFVHIEIEDDTCTPNPLLPVSRYGTSDIRHRLTEWDG